MEPRCEQIHQMILVTKCWVIMQADCDLDKFQVITEVKGNELQSTSGFLHQTIQKISEKWGQFSMNQLGKVLYWKLLLLDKLKNEDGNIKTSLCCIKHETVEFKIHRQDSEKARKQTQKYSYGFQKSPCWFVQGHVLRIKWQGPRAVGTAELPEAFFLQFWLVKTSLVFTSKVWSRAVVATEDKKKKKKELSESTGRAGQYHRNIQSCHC